MVLPTNWNGGMHYSNKYNNGKNSLNAGYKFTKVNAPGITRIQSRTFLKDNSFRTNSINNGFLQYQHGINLTVETNIDSMNSLKWTTKVNSSLVKTRSDFYTESINDEGDSLNNSKRQTTNRAEIIVWLLPFCGDINLKSWPVLSPSIPMLTGTSQRITVFSIPLNNYFDDGVIDYRDTTDQQNIRNNESKSVVTKVSYTEPLMKDTYLEFSYSLGYYSNNTDRITTVNDGSGKYLDRIDSLSNSFVFNRLVTTPGANFRVNKKKYNWSFGASVGFSHFVQKNLTEDSRYNYNFVNSSKGFFFIQDQTQ